MLRVENWRNRELKQLIRFWEKVTCLFVQFERNM
jgi:hypothetical protein